jgi:hypothetical protein
MKHLKHPATIVATLALFVALAGGAYASGLINGSQIKNHSIAAKKLTSSAITTIRGQQAPTEAIYTYDTPPTASPAWKPLGIALNEGLSGLCSISSGTVTAEIGVQTIDGSMTADISNVGYNFATAATFVYVNSFSLPAGTLSATEPIAETSASSGVNENRIDFTQLKPSSGEMAWHLTVTAGATPACHISIAYTPEKITNITGAAVKPATHVTATSDLTRLTGSR